MHAPSASDGAATFYRYRDAQDRLVIVDSPARIPASARSSAERIQLTQPERTLALPDREAIARELHWPSFLSGAACVLLFGCALLIVRGRAKGLTRLAVLAGVAALGTGLYFGWARRLSGQSGELLASPAALIDDARGAVEKMNQKSREQQRVLKELEAER